MINKQIQDKNAQDTWEMVRRQEQFKEVLLTLIISKHLQNSLETKSDINDKSTTNSREK